MVEVAAGGRRPTCEIVTGERSGSDSVTVTNEEKVRKFLRKTNQLCSREELEEEEKDSVFKNAPIQSRDGIISKKRIPAEMTNDDFVILLSFEPSLRQQDNFDERNLILTKVFRKEST